MKSQLLISTAIAGLLTMAATAPVYAADGAGKEKCFGVSMKGKNDCGTAKHSCAGQSTSDKAAEDWKYVDKGSCEKMGGMMKAPEAKESMKK